MSLRNALSAVALCLGLMLSGCSTMSMSQRGGADPFESVNRVSAGFNFLADKYIVKPLAQGYQFVTPRVVQTMVSNFFGNIEDVWVGVNNLLQGKPKAALSDVTRFTINTVFGLLGTVDIASELGLVKHKEDFGQTLGVWGVPPGPYVVLPILGPSSVRDSASLIVDSQASLLGQIEQTGTKWAAYGLRAIDTRAGFLAAEKLIDSASYDDYTFFRNGFFQRRYSQVHDGNPPDEAKPKYDDDDDKDPPKNEPAAPKAVQTAVEMPDFVATLDPIGATDTGAANPAQ
jgi:phospholipid-binding lipoprotein MlaA